MATAPRPRACDGCTLCCKLLRVDALGKPANTWCPSCRAGVGCGIYETRPEDCRVFHCGYLTMPVLDERWRPVDCKMIVTAEPLVNRIVIHVDPGRPGAWRAEPFQSRIRAWARSALREGGQVMLLCNEQATMVFPVGEKAIGKLAARRSVNVIEQMTSSGMIYDAVVTEGTSE